jgi:PleD family two-component response regulator
MKKLLIVDDDEQLAFALAQRLHADNFECVIAHTGEEGFAAAKRELPDVVLLDLMLPGVSGYEVCRHMRGDPQLYATPILVLSGLRGKPEIVHALEQGADDYVTKPFRIDNLLTKIETLVSMKDSLDRVHADLQLPGTDATKRQINHRLARDERVAVCYFDILHASVFRDVHGADAFGDAIKVFAESLKTVRDDMKLYDLYIGYLGGQHFVAVTTYEQFKTYCNTAMSTFSQRVVSLYRPIERKQGYLLYTDRHGRESKGGLMCLSIDVVHNHFRTFRCAQHIFEALAHVRKNAEDGREGGVFVDRRCIAPR